MEDVPVRGGFSDSSSEEGVGGLVKMGIWTKTCGEIETEVNQVT